MAKGTTTNKRLPVLKDVPIDGNNWLRLRGFLTDLKDKFEKQLQNPDPPNQVVNLTATPLTGGIRLSWDAADRATDYTVFRALNSIRFSDAKAIATIARAAGLLFFDPAGQDEAATDQYTYWIRGRNALVEGPLSTSVTTPALAGGGHGGGAWGTITGTLSDQTDLQAALDAKVDENAPITPGTNTKITYDAKGLVTAGAQAALDSSDFANQGTTTTVLHGNAAGNPSFGAVVTNDIAADAVTYPKMQNVSAASRLLGRGSGAGSGDPEEISLGSGLSLSGTTLSVAVGAGGNVVTYGTRASLPAVPAAGTLYICTDSPYQYLSDGVNWNAMLYGQQVTEPSGLTKINSGPTTTLDQTYGGYKFSATGAGDQVVAYVKAVTPSSTLRVALGYLQGTSAQVGYCIYNSNNNKIYFFRSISANGNDYQPFRTIYTSDGASIGSPNTNIAGGAAFLQRRIWPLGIIILRFDSTKFYIDTCTDTLGNGIVDNMYSEDLSTNIGSNFTHVGFAVNLGGNVIWGQHLQILHT